MDKRYGFVGITIENKEDHALLVQKVLSEYSETILGRMGLPHLEENKIAVITLIVQSTTDELGALTGKLGRIPGVSVKSGLTKRAQT
ncbi:TM1266 family iron-only hydrogenase system putative regulator [Oceanispirochaeta sp.]|jgi:putative iron-only hydrogenase system regulator|uniref:TM1266 family iron-only hydrogenase system putative regulator n=1 Tax=Oceanispirochaeta sp. TaxID=2035350 RepID=UPI00261BA526|nr:TM1266 family iron-only hydrogenase system putative regulator [Oceanispirochaeta sp.]MDA3956047.1 CopG family transcriptional regulator [Oceanispirochaeta sp.]